MTVFVTLDDLLSLIDDLAIGPIRDLGLLDSAAHRPTVRLYGQRVYATIDDQAAVLLESLVRNHGLVDGNERLGWLAVVVFYRLNGIELDAPDDDAFDLVVGIASGQADATDAAAALRTWHD